VGRANLFALSDFSEVVNMLKHKKERFTALFIFAWGILMIALISPVSAETKGFDSPELVFKNVVEAANAKDFNKLCKSIAPDDLATINMVMIAGGSMIVAFAQMAAEIPSGIDGAKSDMDLQEKEKAKKAAEEVRKLEADFKTILKKHKIEEILKDDTKPAPKDEREAREHLASVFKDVKQCGLMTDLFAFFDKMPGEKSQKSSWRSPGCTELKELKIEGELATAKCGIEKLSFKKFENRWYINPEETGKSN
jgi:hypothetical protein